MKAADANFRTAVRGVRGAWPEPPPHWSYSSLSDVEECPRRWALRRAKYPGLWKGTGYPPRPILQGLVGSVTHHVLEAILRAFHARGCESVSDPCAVEVLREVGGYSTLIEAAIADELEALERNPRAAARVENLRSGLLREIPDIRQRVQATISRVRLKPRFEHEAEAAPGDARRPLGRGSHTEVELRSEELRFMGRADLITIDDTCVITDYKTGEPNERHADQLRLYSLLWSRDRDHNPDGLPVEKLVVSYAARDEVFDPPPDSELEMLADQLGDRISDAERALARRPPPAYPAPDTCRFCSVRHLCDEYWESVGANAVPDAASGLGTFVDCEAEVASRNGPRSWTLTLDVESDHALLRTATEDPAFSVGDSVRLLGVALGRVEDAPGVILTMTQFSEVFVLGGRGS